jgi:hypothetical protein
MATSLCKICLGLVLLLAMEGCRKEPNYAKEPHIEYQNIEHATKQDQLGSPFETITFAVRFQDGNGDLGLSNEKDHPDTLPPYAFLNPDNTLNRFHYNFFIDTFVKKDGVFVPHRLPNPNFPHHGRFLRLSQDDRIEPLEGILKYTLRLSPDDQLQVGSVVKFRLSIADRALNESNTVETDEITLFTGN